MSNLIQGFELIGRLKLRLTAWLSLSLLAALLGGVQSCSQSDPSISFLNSVGRMVVPSSSNLSAVQSSAPLSLAGTCDARVKSVSLSFDGGATWAEASTVSLSGGDWNCTDRSFNLQIDGNQMAKLWQNHPSVDASGNAVATVQIRGSGIFGDSQAAEVAVQLRSDVPSSFNIKGVTGVGDTVQDAWLRGTVPTITWDASGGQSSYEVSILKADGVSVQCPVVQKTAEALSNTFAGCNLLEGQSYRAVVLAKNADGKATAAGNGPFAFVVDNTGPTAPTIAGLTGGADTLADAFLSDPAHVTVNWNDVPDEAKYLVTIYDSGGTSVVCAQTEVPQNSTHVDMPGCTLSDMTNYKAVLVAVDAAGNSTAATNSPYAFMVNTTVLNPFTVVGIMGGTDVAADAWLNGGLVPTVVWNDTNSEVSYNVEIYDSTGSTQICAHTTAANVTSYAFTAGCTLSEATSYRARVTATDALSNTLSTPDYAFSVDNVAPTISSVAGPSNTILNATASSIYTVTYSGANSVSLGAADITLSHSAGVSCTVTVTGTGTATRTVTLSACTGNGSVGLSSIAAGTAADTAGNLAAAYTPSATSITVDNTSPTVILSTTAPSPTNTTLSYTADFSEAVTGFSATGVSITACPGTCAVANFVVVSTTRYTFDVTVSGANLTGNVSVKVSASAAVDGANNPNSVSNGLTNSFDNDPPSSPSLVINAGDIYTNTTAVSLATSASGASEMYITNTAACAGGGAWEAIAASKAWTLAQTNATATVYAQFRDATHNVSACVSATIIHDNLAPTSPTIAIQAGAAYTNTAAVSLSLSAVGAGEMYISNSAGCTGGTWEAYATSKSWTLAQTNATATVYVKYRDAALNETACINDTIIHDDIAPTVNITTGAASPTNAATISYTATFSEAVTGFSLGGINLSHAPAGSTLTNFAGSGTTYTFDVTVSATSVVDTVSVVVSAGTATDPAGNANTASATKTISFDNQAPTVTINKGASQVTPTNVAAISYDVVFSESVTGFSSAGVTLSGTGTGSVTSVTGSGTTYVVTVTATADGTITADLAAGVAHDTAGNLSAAATFTTHTVTYLTAAPTITSVDFGTTTTPTDVLANTLVYSASGSVAQMNIYSDSTCTTSATAGWITASSGSNVTLTAYASNHWALQLRDTLGNTSTCVPTTHTVATGLIMGPYYGTNNYWNDYVTAASTPTSVTLCTGGETADYKNCLHAGIRRKAKVLGATDCSSVGIPTDNLGVFQWQCEMIGGVPFVSTVDFVSGKGLSNLINFGTPALLKPVLTVTVGGTARSNLNTTAAWWSDGVIGTAPNPMNTPNTIYTFNSTSATATTYTLSSRTSIVIAPGQYIEANTSAPILLVGANFAWVEGHFQKSVATGAYVAYFNGTKFSRIHNSSFSNAIAGPNNTDLYVNVGGGNTFTSNTISAGPMGLAMVSTTGNLVDGLSISGVGNASATAPAMLIGSSNFNTFRNIRVSANQLTPVIPAIGMANSSNNMFTNLFASYNKAMNLELVSASNSNTFNGLYLSNSQSYGLQVQDSSNNAFVNLVTASNGDSGVYLSSTGVATDNNTFVGLSSVNNAGAGIQIYSSGTLMNKNIFHSLLLANNSGNGIDFSRAISTVVSNFVSVNNGSFGLYAGTLSSMTELHGRAILAGNASGCGNGEITAGFTNACLNNGPYSNAIWTTSFATLSSTFVGEIATDDPTNAGSYYNNTAYTNVTDWINFSNPYRLWTRDGGAFPTSTFRAPCVSGNCSIFDYTLRNTDATIRNSSVGAGGTNGVFIAGANCPSAAQGSNAIVPNFGGSTPYLQAGIEDMNSTGNHNGLCEAGENCIYAPNFGAYQGEGTLAGCNFSANGGLSGIQIQGYSTNGQ